MKSPGRHVRFWHLADITVALTDGRSLGRSRRPQGRSRCRRMTHRGHLGRLYVCVIAIAYKIYICDRAAKWKCLSDCKEASISPKHFIKLVIVTFGIFAGALGAGQSTTAAAQAVSYPWCTQEEVLHCYYSTRQQCEEEVDYHGFCVTNPDYSPPNNMPSQRSAPHY